MTNSLGKIAAVAVVAAAVAMPAAAQVRGKLAGDIVIGASVIGVIPQNGSGGDVSAIGGHPHADSAITGQLDFSYFLTPNFAVNLIAATTNHDLSVRNSSLGTVELGDVWVLPPTLTFQYHPLPAERFSPYFGVGINYTAFYDEGGSRNPAVTDVRVHGTWGFALNIGLDVEVAPGWSWNIDVKKLFLRPDATVDTALGTIRATANLDPWVVGTGIRYRF